MIDEFTEGGILVNMPGGGSKWVAVPEYEDPRIPKRTGEWTEEEKYLLTKLYSRYGASLCARALSRDTSATMSAARRLGVRGSLLTVAKLPCPDTLGRVA